MNLTPSEIVAELDRHIVGQGAAAVPALIQALQSEAQVL